GRSGSASASLTWTAQPLPSIAMDGGTSQTWYRGDVIWLFARSKPSSCGNATSALTYVWTETQQLLTFTSTSLDPRYLALPAYTLASGDWYTFE
ncbi:unnamed protein product, partial [Phaeothamnion confervicola]